MCRLLCLPPFPFLLDGEGILFSRTHTQLPLWLLPLSCSLLLPSPTSACSHMPAILFSFPFLLLACRALALLLLPASRRQTLLSFRASFRIPLQCIPALQASRSRDHCFYLSSLRRSGITDVHFSRKRACVGVRPDDQYTHTHILPDVGGKTESK